MISDEPDEDADHLDDENLLITYLERTTLKPDSDVARPVLDWPLPMAQEFGLNVDAETLRWFETNHADWRHEMCAVLRAWVDLRTRSSIGATQTQLSLSSND